VKTKNKKEFYKVAKLSKMSVLVPYHFIVFRNETLTIEGLLIKGLLEELNEIHDDNGKVDLSIKYVTVSSPFELSLFLKEYSIIDKPHSLSKVELIIDVFVKNSHLQCPQYSNLIKPDPISKQAK
jgi:hypothetical protein